MRMRPALLTLALAAALLTMGAGGVGAAPKARLGGAALGKGGAAPAASFSPAIRARSPKAKATNQSLGGLPGAAPRLGASNPLSDPPPNDQCSGAIVIPCGTFNYSGNTQNAANDYTFTDSTLSCTGYREDGNDIVYQVAAQAGDSLWLRYYSLADGAVYIVTDCGNVQGTCVAGADLNPEAGQIEALNYGFKTAGTYYIILDSYGLGTSGAWSLVGQFLSCGLSPPANDRCTTAAPLPCGTINLSGSTETAFNDYSFPTPDSSCFGALANGRDVVYLLTVTAGDSLHLNYRSTADGVMYIIADCADPASSCIVGVNNTGVGGVETLDYRFSFTGTYYLVLDSNGNDDFGAWSATGTLVCVNPPPSNDRCDAAIEIPCGPISLSGSTAFAYNDYTTPADSTSCTGGQAAGPDVVYLINAHVGDSLSVDYHSTADGVMYMVTDCGNVGGTCVAGSDVGVEGDTEHLDYTFTSPGFYYLILDSYDVTPPGTWTLNGNLVCSLSAVDGPGSAAKFRVGDFQPNPFAGSSNVNIESHRQFRAAL